MGGTTFTFVTDGIHSALDQARTAVGDRDVAIAGGAVTVNRYLAAGLIDELRTHIPPVTLGAGERLFDRVPPLQLELLAAGLVDEVRIHLINVLLGGGRRLFDRLPERMELEQTGLSQTDGVTHLEYRVLR